MKFTPFSTLTREQRAHLPNRPQREPQYTVEELAQLFDVLPGQLQWAIRSAEVPVPNPASLPGIRPTRYPLHAMRKWWLEIGGKEAAVSKRFAYSQTARERIKRLKEEAARAQVRHPALSFSQ